MRIIDVYPHKAQYRPGDKVNIIAEIVNESMQSWRGRLQTRFLYLATEIAALEQNIVLQTGSKQQFIAEWMLPVDRLKGYGVDVYLYDTKGQLLDEASTAFDVAEDWTLSPRYGFLSDFSRDEEDSSERLLAMNKFHINGVQFYDWMFRHDTLLPLKEEFNDPLGRRLSLKTIQNKIALAHQYNMVTMAYTAIYGASKEFYLQHKDWALYQADGKPHTFGGDSLYIMNPDEGSPWRTRLLKQYQEVLQNLDFDGIHIDQYGDPKFGYSKVGGKEELIQLEKVFPSFINSAKVAVKAVELDAKIIFNAVNNWPIQAVAPAEQDLVYVEVWPPHTTYKDLAKIIEQGRRLSGGKQVVLAAYIPPSQEISVRLANAVIFAHGGFHIEIGELNGMLADPYFPKYQRMSPHLRMIMRNYYDFLVRYENFLNDAIKNADIVVTLLGIPTTDCGESNAVWVIAREKPGFKMINLVNLMGIHALWRDNQSPPRELKNISVKISLAGSEEIRNIYLASPDFNYGRAALLKFKSDSKNSIEFVLPYLVYWDLLIIETENNQC